MPSRFAFLTDGFRNWWNRNDLDGQFRESYRNVLFGQYRSLTNTVENAPAKSEADAIVATAPAEIEWEDLYRLELAIIRLESPEALRRRAWILQNEYKEIASPDEYKDYLASNPPKPDAGDEKVLRADLVHLQEELNWRYIVIWMLEAYRGRLLRRLVFRTLLAIGVSVLIAYLPLVQRFVTEWTNLNIPFLVLIVVPGVVGGLISTLRRVQNARFGKNADLDLSDMEQGDANTYLSPFLGGVFAFLLYFLFASDFVTGNLFPKVTVDNLLDGGLAGFATGEIAKLIVWSFMAGFAEKFVPDRLERLAQQAAAPAGGGGQPGVKGQGTQT